MTEAKSPEELQKDLEQLKGWVAQQPHMPKDMDDKLLRRFLHSCYYDMGKAQKAMETFSSLRASSPELFKNRDPLSAETQHFLKIINIGHVKASGNRDLWLWQLNDPGLEKFDYLQDARLFFLTSDAWLLEADHLADCDIVVLDTKDITLRILTKLNISVARKLGKYQEEAMPIRLKQIHIYNAPGFIDKIFSVMKQFLHKDMAEMIHFHLPNSDTLYKYISKDDLPSDFGGNLPSMSEHMERVLKVLYKHRETLLNDNLWTAPEKKSKKKSKNASAVVTQSTDEMSFRSLAID
ncbi:hypothetical protein MSG28_012403 [Choristoneura fumiferana]|uniref:Uncharacterized protein n=1 Tax=Choristoneura fumiferana TaxID=7141 RepID=A0ACC0KDQ4_CHOFU|nr:hypothetical protein MSG28_012403 [Choristoneura fumiferana]